MTAPFPPLTPEQEAHLLQYRDEMLAFGRSTDPAIREVPERVFKEVYASLDRAAPTVIWASGPASGVLIRSVLHALYESDIVSEPDQIPADLWPALDAAFTRHISASFESPGSINLAQTPLSTEAINLIRACLPAAPKAAKLQAAVASQVAAHVTWWFWGQHQIYWSAYYTWPDKFVQPIHTEEQRTKLAWWHDIAMSMGWWQPYESYVIACERQAEIHVDSEGRLSNLTGPALRMRDGWRLYSVGGVRVPAFVVEHPETITPKMMMDEPDVEIRRVMLARYGEARYIRDLGLEPIHEDEYGVLYSADRGEDSPLRLVKVVNSTPEALGTQATEELSRNEDGSSSYNFTKGPDGRVYKVYWIRVPSTCETAHAAVAWSFSKTPAEYQPEIET